MAVIHTPRVAWDGARAFVSAATTDVYWWLSEAIGRYLGLMYQFDLANTRIRLQGEDAHFAEAGVWRARLEELLHSRPDLLPLVQQLVSETSCRLTR
ncbi:hypothetical protein [Thermoactinospora rubra]|uniref:hypothetical protein n=1 Tax=Thermoactinospora rubra TaxID=1088767 RepID=UPI00117DC21F|nr:hypothetical protein [Thermoactinospora rubra]